MASSLIERAEETWRLHLGSVPLWRRPFFRNVAVLAGGSVAGQIISLAFSPIITRLYGPEAFGILGVFTSVVSIGIPAATLGYAYAIVLPARDEDALRLVGLALVLAGIVALVATALILPFRRLLAAALGIENAAPYLLLIPVVVLCGGVSTTLDHWLIRKKQFQASSGITIAERLLTNGAKAGAGLIAPVAGTLIGIAAGGRGLHAMLAALSSRDTRRRAARAEATKSRLLDERSSLVLREYRDFPVYRLPQILLNSLGHSLPTMLLASFFDPSTAGLYALAVRVLHLPGSIIASAVGKVFEQRVAAAAHEGESLRKLIVRATLGLVAAGVAPFALIMALGPGLFSFAFGPEWKGAGQYARWLGLWLFFGFINKPSVSAIPILGLQGHLLAYEVVTLVAVGASLLVGSLVLRSEMAAIALFSITGTVSYCSLIAYVVVQSKRRLRRMDPSVEAASRGKEGHDA